VAHNPKEIAMTAGYSGHDRRRTTRRIIAAEEGITIQVELGGQSLRGLIETINKNGLRASFPASQIDEVCDTGSFATIITGPRFDQEFHVPGLSLKRHSRNSSGDLQIVLTADSMETKALLWQVMYKLDHIEDTSVVHRRIEDDQALRIPGRGHYTEKARQERIEFIRRQSGKPLEILDQFSLTPERLSSNIENLVGSVEIPVGLAGPLLFRGQKAKGIFYAPFATTEGALVASATRGATAITRSGGMNTRVLKQQMFRVPMFHFEDLNSSSAFSQWVVDHIEEIKAETRKVSRYANLSALEPLVSGASVHVRFIYETGDAAGQNMTTTCTWQACMWILEAVKHVPYLRLVDFAIEGNASGDKKVNFLSYIQGRGTAVAAECFIHEEDLQKILKVGSKQLAIGYNQNVQGAMRSGMVGNNINIANVIGAMFTALGQDIACVHESSIGILNIEAAEGGLYASLYLPSLVVGTVGGGTALPGQNQYLQILGCAGAENSSKLAEIIAGFCLALDISTMCAVSSGQFAMAHEKLGRNRPVQYLTHEEMNLSFFQKILPPKLGGLQNMEAMKRTEDGSSIISELASRKLTKVMGHFPQTFTFEDGRSLRCMIKIKPLDSEVLLMMVTVASMCHPVLGKSFRQHHQKLGFERNHVREIAIFKQTDPRFVSHAPAFYGSLEDPSREIFLYAMENIDGLSHFNAVDHQNKWDEDALRAVVSGLASLHSIWWKREEELAKQPWMGTIMNARLMTEMSELWTAFGTHAAHEFPEWFTQELLEGQTLMIESLPDWWGRLEAQPKTLIHNDFNPRNIALRKEADGYHLCAYDWELATVHVPQHDLAEFLMFTSSKHTKIDEVERWVELHRILLEKATGDSIDPRLWREGFALSLMDLMLHRVSLYIMAHTMHHYKFIQRITENCWHLITITRPWQNQTKATGPHQDGSAAKYKVAR
jgi:NADP-dependent 3-hydroxy-3-methylglutaryl-CoA reductase